MPLRDLSGVSSDYMQRLAAAPPEQQRAWLLGEWPGPTLTRLEELRREYEQLRRMHEALSVAIEQFGHALGLACSLEENEQNG